MEKPGELAEIEIAGGNQDFGMSEWVPAQATYALWEQIRDNQQAFSGIFAWSAEHVDLGGAGRQNTLNGLLVTGRAFATLGLAPYRGRLLGPADDRSSGPA